MSSTSFNVVSESTTCSSIIKAKDDTLNFTDNDLNFNFNDIVDDVSDEEEPAENETKTPKERKQYECIQSLKTFSDAIEFVKAGIEGYNYIRGIFKFN